MTAAKKKPAARQKSQAHKHAAQPAYIWPDYPEPDWGMWGEVEQATLLEAAALSCNVDPDSLRHSDGQDFFIQSGDPNAETLKEIRRRLKVLTANLGSKSLPLVKVRGITTAWRTPTGALMDGVRLTNVSAFAESNDWGLPERFPTDDGPSSKKKIAPKLFTDALEKFLVHVETLATQHGKKFDRFHLPATKKDFHKAAIVFNDQLAHPFPTFETYLKLAKLCTFVREESDCYRKWFPEAFR